MHCCAEACHRCMQNGYGEAENVPHQTICIPPVSDRINCRTEADNIVRHAKAKINALAPSRVGM
eukprot:8794958-Karenia_brevis.AAC.1